MLNAQLVMLSSIQSIAGCKAANLPMWGLLGVFEQVEAVGDGHGAHALQLAERAAQAVLCEGLQQA